MNQTPVETKAKDYMLFLLTNNSSLRKEFIDYNFGEEIYKHLKKVGNFNIERRDDRDRRFLRMFNLDRAFLFTNENLEIRLGYSFLHELSGLPIEMKNIHSKRSALTSNRRKQVRDKIKDRVFREVLERDFTKYLNLYTSFLELDGVKTIESVIFNLLKQGIEKEEWERILTESAYIITEEIVNYIIEENERINTRMKDIKKKTALMDYTHDLLNYFEDVIYKNEKIEVEMSIPEKNASTPSSTLRVYNLKVPSKDGRSYSFKVTLLLNGELRLRTISGIIYNRLKISLKNEKQVDYFINSITEFHGKYWDLSKVEPLLFKKVKRLLKRTKNDYIPTEHRTEFIKNLKNYFRGC